jgi:hypothetical protein
LWGISIWQLGWQNHQEFLTRVMPAMSQGLPHFENRSLSTLLYVVSTGKFVSFEDARKGAYIPSPETPFPPIRILAILTFGGFLFFFWYVNKTDSQIYTEVFLLLLWSILFSPVALAYNYLLALMPLVFAWIHPLAQKTSAFQLMLLSASTFMIFSILPNYAAYLTGSFIVQFTMFLVRPAGVILCMWYLMKLLKSENKVLAEYS